MIELHGHMQSKTQPMQPKMFKYILYPLHYTFNTHHLAFAADGQPPHGQIDNFRNAEDPQGYDNQWNTVIQIRQSQGIPEIRS